MIDIILSLLWQVWPTFPYEIDPIGPPATAHD
jgi:hypothetical protein